MEGDTYPKTPANTVNRYKPRGRSAQSVFVLAGPFSFSSCQEKHGRLFPDLPIDTLATLYFIVIRSKLQLTYLSVWLRHRHL